jgi:glycerate kinase
MVAQLDANLSRYAGLINRDLRVQVDSVPGAGAAGGMGAALLAFFGAKLRPGHRNSRGNGRPGGHN